jgi:hypothetical protein
MASGGLSDLLVSALTWGDILGCLRSVTAFAALLLAPGYCLAWACDLLGFRARAAGERMAWGVALSFGGMTIVSVLLGKYGSLTAVCWLAGICALGCVGIMAREAWSRRRGLNFANKRGLIGAGIAAAWLLFAIFELVDIGVGSRLYFSVTVFDHALRTAFVDAVMRTGVPPANPLFWPGHAAPMRYYYFWYVLTAAAARLAGATARQAMIASVAWSGFGLAATLQLYCRNFLGSVSQRGSDAPQLAIPSHPSHETTQRWMRRPPRLALALGLLAVTGLDILPVLVKAMLRMKTDGDMEWWSAAQVSSWMDSLLWVPHHIAGLVCCLLGFLLVWMSKGTSRGRRALSGLIAGLAFASAFGLSTWIALAFAMVMFAWMLWALAWERGSRARVPVLLLAAVVASVALLPYLAELHGEASGTATVLANGLTSPDGRASVANDGSHLLRFGVRHVIPADSVQGIGWIARLAQTHPAEEDAVVGLVLLLPGYFVELGFYGLVLLAALWAMHRRRLDEAARTALLLAVTGLAVSTFLRSTIVENNDFAMRSILIAQFFLLLLAVMWWEGGFASTNRFLRGAMLAMAWIGLAGTVYQAVLLRVYLPVEERLGRAEVDGLAERAMAVRLGFDAMHRRVARNAVVQYDIAQPGEFFYLADVMQAGRQMASATPGCGAAFGGDAGACQGVEQGVARLFAADSSRGPLPATSPELPPGPSPRGVSSEQKLQGPSSGGARSASQARDQCARLGVDDLVATRWDAVWSDPRGWVWTLPAVADTGEVRVLACAAPAR